MIDFERVLLLLSVIVEAGKHGQQYEKVGAKAREEMDKVVKSLEEYKRPDPLPLAAPRTPIYPSTSGTKEQQVYEEPEKPVERRI